MHTETYWHSGDLEENLQSVIQSNRSNSTSQALSGENAVELHQDEMTIQAATDTPSDSVSTTTQPTTRKGTGEYDALLGRVLKQVEDVGAAGFVGFTSCRRRSGVSTIAANVAIRAADRNNGSVLLVEANLLHPRQRQHFGIVEMPGLFEVLRLSTPIDKAITPTRVPNLFLLGVGMVKSHIPPIIMQDALEGFVQELRERFSLVVFDLPNDQSLSHWAPLVRHLESLLVVIASEETTQDDLLRIHNQCVLDNIQITGSILNLHKSYIPRLFQRRN